MTADGALCVDCEHGILFDPFRTGTQTSDRRMNVAVGCLSGQGLPIRPARGKFGKG